MDNYNTIIHQSEKQYLHLKLNSRIPNHMSWIVKMWDFGEDGLTRYSSEKFDMIWKDSLNVFYHIYSKEYGKKKMKSRKEVQEYPNKPLKDALMDKLKDDDDNRNKTFAVEI